MVRVMVATVARPLGGARLGVFGAARSRSSAYQLSVGWHLERREAAPVLEKRKLTGGFFFFPFRDLFSKAQVVSLNGSAVENSFRRMIIELGDSPHHLQEFG